jgi:hypothetical protein
MPLSKLLTTLALGWSMLFPALIHADSFAGFTPGNLVVSRSVYTGDANTVTVGQKLPPNCPHTASCPTATATNDGTYPNVFNNALVDGSFGVTSPIYLDQITTAGNLISTYAVPGILSTSFPSKSELALNLSDDRSLLTFMVYVVGPNVLDVSNSNTPGVYDPTNPAGDSYYRAIAQLDASGNLQYTETNAYSGNNGRAAVLASGLYFTVGNSNNGSGTPANVVAAAGAQVVIPGAPAGAPIEVGNFSITQVINPDTGLPYPPDKAGKDNNFRGLTVFNNTLYIAKGSGGNGINTVYQVGNAGTLPTVDTAASTPITILPGFPKTLAKNPGAQNPFGLWFANATTLYVADEGDGTMANAASSPNAGLQKWILVNGAWQRVYVLQKGLNLGAPYSVSNDYPAALNPATDGLRNITGRLNADGTATIWAITSTVSANGDQGADPNKLVTITDTVANTDPAAASSEQFAEVRSAGYGEVLRGIGFTPGTPVSPAAPDVPVTTSAFLYDRISRTYTGAITVTNNTAVTINGPVTVTLTNLTPGVTVVSGSPVISFPVTSLLPGQSSTASVTFNDPSNAHITFTPVVAY